MEAEQPMPWRPVLAAGAAVLVGNGLGRFAYAPILPVLIAQGWFTPGQAGYLGAANLLGYLLGVLASRQAASRFGLVAVLRGAMLAAALSLFACATPMPFAWFCAWRLLSGMTGGLLMILAPSAVLHHVPPRRRGLAGGLIFTGVGLGIAASGTLVPALLQRGLPTAWLGLGVVSALLTALAWPAWPPAPARNPAPASTSAGSARPSPMELTYGLCAVGLVPHMIFLVDYVARGQGHGLAAGNLAWVLFGAGALFGAVAAGRVSDRTGGATAMRIVLATELACVLILATAASAWLAQAGAFAAGLCVSGVTTAMLGRIHDRVGPDPVARQRGWTRACVAWAVGQATAAYGLAWLYARTGSYAVLLATAAAALVLAGILEVAARRR